jgi:hypothetical protein
MMELAIKTATADSKIGSQRAESDVMWILWNGDSNANVEARLR